MNKTVAFLNLQVRDQFQTVVFRPTETVGVAPRCLFGEVFFGMSSCMGGDSEADQEHAGGDHISCPAREYLGILPEELVVLPREIADGFPTINSYHRHPDPDK